MNSGNNGTDVLAVLPIESISRYEHQPRIVFDEMKLQQLAESIKAKGLLNPIIVKPNGGNYILVDGERRWRACRIAGLTNVPSIIRSSIDADEHHFESLILNFNREGHTHKEIHRSLMREVARKRGVSEIATAIGKSEVWCYMYLSLRKLAPQLLELLDLDTDGNEKLRFEEAVKLARLETHEEQIQVFEECKGLPLRKRKYRIQKAVEEKKASGDEGGRKKDMKDHRRTFFTAVDAIDLGVENILDMPNAIFVHVAERLGSKKTQELIEKIEFCAQSLISAKESLEEALSK